ncbi:replication protein [Aggregatibacter phage S1249]|uniref:replication initiation O-like n=1 Tax=Aggregatibacter phage S1249 TaxID=683735 RepID=UPI0001BA150B|nr:replication initiation O-like [Aggregatibacter phage S1249]ACX80326.1 replication protein [Aggregatibacter phage S1249]
MSMRLMAQAMSIKVGNPLRKLVLIKLADNANDDGICFPSYQYIADVCEISKASARTHIDALIKMGFVSKKARKNKDGSSSNLYLLHLEKGMPADSTGMPADSTGMPADSTGGMPADSTITCHSSEPVNKPKKTSQKNTALSLLAEFGITGQLADDFAEHRKSKKAAITRTALEGFQREADKAGIPLAEAIEIAICQNWQGFRADWCKNLSGAKGKKRDDFADDGSWAIGRTVNVPRGSMI